MNKSVVIVFVSLAIGCIQAILISILSATYQVGSPLDGSLYIETGIPAIKHYVTTYGFLNYLRGLLGSIIAFAIFSSLSTFLILKIQK